MSGTVTSTGSSRLERARDAVSVGDWRIAFDLLRSEPADGARSGEEFELLATAAYGAGEFEAAITAWEQLHATAVAGGDHVEAARAAATVAMYLMMETGLMAPVRGWLRRAERLLTDQDETPVHAMLAMVRAYERLMCGDAGRAGHWAHRAIELGSRQDAPAAVAIARIAAARVEIAHGRVDEGLELLDEAAVPILAGELDALTTGMAYCELICAMQWLAQYDRAEEWTEAMERWRRGTAFGSINGRCRVHRAEILRLRGSCAEAEDEALHACEELRPWMRREFGWPLTELGTIRLRKGDLAGAEEAFLAAHEHGWEPQPGLALLHLARGDTASASALVAGALAHPVALPWKERPPFGELQRAPLLDAQVEIAVAADDIATARCAAEELTAIAGTFSSRALAAGATLARGRVALAAGDHATAIAECEQALGAWAEVGAPYETAVARTVLATAYQAQGSEDRAQLEWRAAQATFDRLGAVGKITAATRDRGDAADAPTVRPSSAPPPPEVFRCDGDTRTISFDGRTVLVHDLKGLRYLARLLAEPGREFHVVDLVAVERGSLPTRRRDHEGLAVSDGGHAGAVLDEQAKQAYRRRLTEIDEDIDEAERMHDLERAALARADRDFLIGELTRAVGLGGRGRRAADTSERARTSVTRALRYAMARIAEHHPALNAHLDHAVRTGTYCVYAPDPRTPITWQM